MEQEPLYPRMESQRGHVQQARRGFILAALMSGAFAVVLGAAYVAGVRFELFVSLVAATLTCLGLVLLAALLRTGRAHRRFSDATSSMFAVLRPSAVSAGTYLPTQRALHDIALATGMRDAPPLWRVESDTVNAIILTDGGCSHMVISEGLVSALSEPEQGAVFAYLLAVAIHASEGRVDITADPLAVDRYALQILHDPQQLVSALLKTADRNAARQIPDHIRKRLVSALAKVRPEGGGASLFRRDWADAITSLIAGERSDHSSGRFRNLPLGVTLAAWDGLMDCEYRAIKIAEVSGVEGVFSLGDLHLRQAAGGLQKDARGGR